MKSGGSNTAAFLPYHLLFTANSKLSCSRLSFHLKKIGAFKSQEAVEPPNMLIVPEIQRDLWIYLKDLNGRPTPLYRCYIWEFVNVAEDEGHVIIRSYYSEEIQGHLYCEEDLHGKPVNLTNSYLINRK